MPPKRRRTQAPPVVGVNPLAPHRVKAALIMTAVWMVLSWISVVGMVVGTPFGGHRWSEPEGPSFALIANAVLGGTIFVGHLLFFQLTKDLASFWRRALIAFGFSGTAAFVAVCLMGLAPLSASPQAAAGRDVLHWLGTAAFATGIGVAFSPHVFLLGSCLSAGMGVSSVRTQDLAITRSPRTASGPPIY